MIRGRFAPSALFIIVPYLFASGDALPILSGCGLDYFRQIFGLRQ